MAGLAHSDSVCAPSIFDACGGMDGRVEPAHGDVINRYTRCSLTPQSHPHRDELVEYGAMEKIFTAPDNKRTDNISPAVLGQAVQAISHTRHGRP
jgi:hypothetical protein